MRPRPYPILVPLAMVLSVMALVAIGENLAGSLSEESGGGSIAEAPAPASLWNAVIPASAVLAGTIITFHFTNRREYARLEHERQLKQAELEEGRLAKLREDRLKAYATFARLTTPS